MAEHAGVEREAPRRRRAGSAAIRSSTTWSRAGAPRAHDWIVIADSNVLMPPDYIQRLFASWRADTGLVCSPPVGCLPDGFWAELECAFLNTYQARWQYFADALGFGFAQGKTMLWRRDDLEQPAASARSRRNGRGRSGDQSGRAAGLKVRLVDCRSSSRSVIAAPERSGTGSCAGRGCGGRASSPILFRKSFPAACCQ